METVLFMWRYEQCIGIGTINDIVMCCLFIFEMVKTVRGQEIITY